MMKGFAARALPRACSTNAQSKAALYPRRRPCDPRPPTRAPAPSRFGSVSAMRSERRQVKTVDPRPRRGLFRLFGVPISR